MLKSTLVLNNGSTAQIECDTADQLVDILSKFGNNTPPVQAQVVARETPTANYSERRSPGAVQGSWSQKDVLLVAEKIVETGARHGTIQNIVKFLMKNGEQKRSRAVIYLMVSRMKHFLVDGRVRGTGLSSQAMKVLRDAGYDSGSVKKVQATTKNRRSVQHWSDRDIVEIGKIIRDNLNVDSGLTNMVIGYVKNNADVRTRTNATLYTTTSDIKRYLKDGDASRITSGMRMALGEAGIYPLKSPTRTIIPQEA